VNRASLCRAIPQPPAAGERPSKLTARATLPLAFALAACSSSAPGSSTDAGSHDASSVSTGEAGHAADAGHAGDSGHAVDGGRDGGAGAHHDASGSVLEAGDDSSGSIPDAWSPPGDGGVLLGRTASTLNLFNNLMNREDGGGHLLWGVQNGIATSGVATAAYDNVHTISGKYPGFLGVTFTPGEDAGVAQLVTTHLLAGGVASFFWPARNYVTGGTSEDVTGGDVVSAILPGGAKNAAFLADLAELATLLTGIVDGSGNRLPVILRPWHEMNGDWFWWGTGHCSTHEYVELFQYTVTELRSMGVDNALFAYAAAASVPTEMMARYPDNGFVDIICADAYAFVDPPPKLTSDTTLAPALRAIVATANDAGKIPAVCEGHSGYQSGIQGYWTEYYLNAFKDAGLEDIRYAMVWTSGDPVKMDEAGVAYNQWAPVLDAGSTQSFVKMSQDPWVILRGDRDWFAP
jgi:Glycosyl hydrolase family 26